MRLTDAAASSPVLGQAALCSPATKQVPTPIKLLLDHPKLLELPGFADSTGLQARAELIPAFYQRSDLAQQPFIVHGVPYCQ